MQGHNLCPTLMPFFAGVLFKAFQTTERCYRHRYFWLIKLVSSNGLLEAFATFTGCGCTSNALQLDNFGTFTRFLRDVLYRQP